jgi:hypothetical protein
MDHRTVPFERDGEPRSIANIAADQPQRRMALGQERITVVTQVIDRHPVAAFEQPRYHHRADIFGTSGDKNRQQSVVHGDLLAISLA